MAKYLEINLKVMLEQIGENETLNILSNFYCPLNPDVQNFLKNKAIMFEQQGISSTYMIFASYNTHFALIGYYSLANKFITINKDYLKSKTLQRKIQKFAQFDKERNQYCLSAPLIGQIGKNYYDNYSSLITGDELLCFAFNKVKQLQTIIGGKFVYLECEDKPELINFYTSNGFVNLGKRSSDINKFENINNDYLIQLIKYIR